jgi:quercetin dioxygenase-like cupin family protein
MPTSTGCSGWLGTSAADPLASIGFGWVPKDVGAWLSPQRDGFEHRDLHVSEGAGGAFGVEHIRLTHNSPAETWQAHDVDFEVIYVLAGSTTIQEHEGPCNRLAVGSSVCLPAFLRHRLYDCSQDFEAVRITAPASFVTFLGAETELPVGSKSRPTWRPVYSHDVPGNYDAPEGSRACFRRRDLGTRDPSQQRMHLRVSRATEPVPATGWHYHTMAQWSMLLSGRATIHLGDRPAQTLSVGDVLYIGSGQRMRHNVVDVSGDFGALELCVPATYQTIAVSPPPGIAS